MTITTPASWAPPSDAMQAVLDVLENPRQVGPNQWAAPCVGPGHTHDDLDLRLTQGDSQPVVLSCMSMHEDTPEAVQDALIALGVESRVFGFNRVRIRARAHDHYATRRRAPRKRPAAAKPSLPLLPPPLGDQDRPLEFHDRLVRHGERPDFLDFLRNVRGLSDETISLFKLGTDGSAITMPVRMTWGGKTLNVRRYVPAHLAPEGKKRISGIEGHNSPAVVYPAAVLAGNTVPVLMCEGELDALLANQHAEERYVAVTGTGGAKVPPRDLSMLAGREVHVAYDVDAEGNKGAAKVADQLRGAGAAAVYVWDLHVEFGLDPDSKQDITDLLHRGYSGEDIAAKMAEVRARPFSEPVEVPEAAGDDDVLVAIKAAFLAADDPNPDHYDEGLSDDEVAALPPLRYVVDGWLQRGFYTDFYGAPGSMKTFAANDLARSVRAGVEWHGHAVERGAVMLYSGEGLAQLRDRNAAWDSWHSVDGALDLAPVLNFQRFVDLSLPEGVATVIRTLRRFEAAVGESVVLLVVDPAVEFFTGEENGEGMEQFTRGVRALAQYLDIAVLVVHHSNASGERARGTDHMRMRSGGHVRVERVKDAADRIALVVEKQKNAEHRAVVVDAVPSEDSLVLRTYVTTTAAEYLSQTAQQARTATAEKKVVAGEAERSAKATRAEAMLLAKVDEQPGIAQGPLLKSAKGNQIGTDILESVLADLIATGRIREEIEGTGERAPHRHYPMVNP